MNNNNNNAINIIQLLRTNPNVAVQKYGILTRCPIGYPGGGNCTLNIECLGNNIFQINAMPDPQGQDYYVPWMPQGYSVVIVPDNAPSGTLVITHEMSGGSHIMCQVGDDIKFIYDAGKYYKSENNETVLNTVETQSCDSAHPTPKHIHAWRIANLDPLLKPTSLLTSIIARKNQDGLWDLFASYITR